MPVPTNIEHDDDIDYFDIEAKYKVHAEDGFDTIIVVDRVPVIAEHQRDALLSRLVKVFSRKGCPIKSEDILIPWDDNTQKSKGYIFVEFTISDEAAFALNAMEGYPFDRHHTFIVNLFTDIERYANLDENYIEPEVEEYVPREHLRAWLGDPQGRDQYVTYSGDAVVIHWTGKASQSEVAYERPPVKGKNDPKWTELYVSWSLQGTYFATLLRQGVRLWGGSSFQPQEKFAHPFVMMVDFSPCEQYLVTWSNHPIVVPEGASQGPKFLSIEDEGNNIAVWDIKTGNLLRTFPDIPIETEEKRQMQWPALKWSADGKFVGCLTPGQQISVYELPNMGLHGKKSIKIDGVVDFEWCPHDDDDRDDADKANATKGTKIKENVLAYWTPEVTNQPARVTLMNFPSRTVLRQKNLFGVTRCQLYWQDQGKFLCVKVDRHTRTKKSQFCNLEIFRVREKDFPVEVLELKDAVLDFSWEPKGERFAIVSSNDPNIGNPGISIKTEVNFYQLHHNKGDFRLLRNIPATTSNTIRWSPHGRFVVLATMGSANNSVLQFWDLDTDDFSRKEMPKDDQWGVGIQHLGTAEHYGVTDIEWDPSGRYVGTSASSWKHTLEHGYAIWDFRGQELEKHIIDRFKQFLWRPRPHTLLTKEQQRLIRKDLRKYSRVFDEEDAALQNTVSAELIAYRKRLVDEWNAWRLRCTEDLGGHRRLSSAAHLGKKVQEEIEVWVEELIDELEEVVK